ncbi:MAG: aldo/keto reductase [Bacteroidota bacterium]
MALSDYYTLGRSGLRVSHLALGTMTFGSEWGWGAEKAGAKELFDTYIDAGGNFLDTADLYTNGTSESWLGEFVKERGLRDKVVIASKFSYNAEPGNPNAGGNGRKNILRAVEGSLKRLDTDYLDLYFLHTWDTMTRPEEVMRTLDDLVSAGKVRHIGLSDVPAWYASRAQSIAEWRGYEPISTLQMEYSLVERNIENEFIDLGQQLGMGMMVWSPLGSGLLSGKYKPSKGEVSGEGRLASLANSGNPAFDKFTERNWEIVRTLEEVANEIDRPMAAVAINWVANQAGVSSVILGATKLYQLQETLTSLEFQIPQSLMQKLNQVSKPDLLFPYSFFIPSMQFMLTGGTQVGDKPVNYHKKNFIDAAPAEVE